MDVAEALAACGGTDHLLFTRIQLYGFSAFKCTESIFNDFQPKLPPAAGNRNTIIFPIDHNAFGKLKYDFCDLKKTMFLMKNTVFGYFCMF